MSIVLLIDGYNVIAPVAAPGRGLTLHWLDSERRRLLDRLVEHLQEVVRSRTCVVFDAKDAPRQQLSRFDYQGIDVRFAIGYPEADDLIEELIVSHPAPRGLSVVSSDHRVQAAARRKRAGAFDSAPWLDQLLDGHTQLIRYPKLKPPRPGSTTGVTPPQVTAGELPAAKSHRGKPRRRDAIDTAVDAMLSDAELDELIRRYEK